MKKGIGDLTRMAKEHRVFHVSSYWRGVLISEGKKRKALCSRSKRELEIIDA